MASHQQVSENRPPLTPHDLEYAEMLLDWSKSLDNGYIALELYEVVWRRAKDLARAKMQ